MRENPIGSKDTAKPAPTPTRPLKIEVVPMSVSLEILRLLHDQIRNLPDGAELGGFKVVD